MKNFPVASCRTGKRCFSPMEPNQIMAQLNEKKKKKKKSSAPAQPNHCPWQAGATTFNPCRLIENKTNRWQICTNEKTKMYFF